MTKKELAEALYDEKKRTGEYEYMIPIGRKTPLTKQEFVKRYLHGIGGINGFNKDALEYLLANEKAKPTAKNKKKNCH